jgi:hypothetical protein
LNWKVEIRLAKLAPSLSRFRYEIDRRWPRRDRRSDGWLGDAAHSSRRSDHNPNSRGIVNAIDVDKDGVNTTTIINAAIKHPSTNYVIYNRIVWSAAYGFRARRYTGSNPHTSHIHVSIKQSRTAENSTRSWLPAPVVYDPSSIDVSEVRYGKKSTDVGKFQQALRKYLLANGMTREKLNRLNPGGVTSYYGYETARLVKSAYWRISQQTGNDGWRTLPIDRAGSALTRRIGLTPR